jgi:hypothetical protein
MVGWWWIAIWARREADPYLRCWPLRTLTSWECQDGPDLKLSNRPVRTRMPGGVAGAAVIIAAPLCRLEDLGAIKNIPGRCTAFAS